MAGGVGMNAAKYVLAGGLAVVGPHKPAVVNGGESISYGDLAVRVSRFAAALREVGMKPGDRVALFMLDQRRLGVYLPRCDGRGRGRYRGFDARHERRSSANPCDYPAVRRHRRKRLRTRHNRRHGAECKIVSSPAPSVVVGAKIRDGVRALCPQAGRSGVLGDDVRHYRTA